LSKYFRRKDGIIIDAIKLMDMKGLHGMTTRELAFMQGITEPAIYRQFKNKNDIIQSILEDFAKYDEAISSTVKQFDGTPVEALLYFGKLYSDYYENYPEIASIMFSIEYLKTNENLYEIFKNIIDGRKKTIEELLEKIEMVDETAKSEIAELMNGVFLAQTMFWKMDGCSYSLSNRIESNIRFIMSWEGKK